MLYVAPDGPILDLFAPVPAPANLSARQAKVLGLMTSGNEASACASHQRRLERQQSGECADPVHLLSSVLARHTSEAWADAYEAHAEIGFPLGRNSPARMGRLRGYGNAINTEAATAFIKAYMSATA